MHQIRTIILKIAAVIFSVELLAMALLFSLEITFSPLLEAIVDATFLTVCSAPIIYLWIIKPYIRQRETAEQALTDSRNELEHRVTERTLALENSMMGAERANQAKSEFLSHMSHELRTPMNAVLGFTQLLSIDETLGTAQLEQIKHISNAGNHLLNLIEDVLDLSKIETGNITISLTPVDYKDVLAECIEIIKPLSNARNIDIILPAHDVADNIILAADRTRLKEVLLNLLSNAVKYNIEGGSISIFTEPKNDLSIRIYVTDTGIGLNEDQYTQLFQPFNRLGAEFSQIEGAGIGLTISKHLIEMMGGDIGYEPHNGQGSRFWLELKTSHEPTSMVANASSNDTENSHTDIHPEKETLILYIEDNLSNIRLVEYLTNTREHYRLITSLTQENGIELANLHKPDLILLDINLPGMSGHDVFTLLKQDNTTQHIPVVAVSANAIKMNIDKCITFGFSDYITKPIDGARFYEVIDNIITAPAVTGPNNEDG